MTHHAQIVVIGGGIVGASVLYHLGQLGRLIAGKGGRLIDHVYVRRGRILPQLSGKELMARVRDVLDSRAGKWPAAGAAAYRPPTPFARN